MQENECSCSKRVKVRSEKERKPLITHINRVIGQLNGVKNMINDDRYCDDILIQLSAVDKSIKSLANKMLETHMKSCLVESIKRDETEAIDEVIELVKRFQ